MYFKVLDGVYIGEQDDITLFEMELNGQTINVDETRKINDINSLWIPLLSGNTSYVDFLNFKSSKVTIRPINRKILTEAMNNMLCKGIPLMLYDDDTKEIAMLAILCYLMDFDNMSLGAAKETLERVKSDIKIKTKWLK